MVSEHLAAAISGTSRYVVQGTAGTTEDQVKYSWNYATLLAKGPSERALVASPIYRAMTEGRIVRFEELTQRYEFRPPAPVQLRTLPVAETASPAHGRSETRCAGDRSLRRSSGSVSANPPLKQRRSRQSCARGPTGSSS